MSPFVSVSSSPTGPTVTPSAGPDTSVSGTLPGVGRSPSPTAHREPATCMPRLPAPPHTPAACVIFITQTVDSDTSCSPVTALRWLPPHTEQICLLARASGGPDSPACLWAPAFLALAVCSAPQTRPSLALHTLAPPHLPGLRVLGHPSPHLSGLRVLGHLSDVKCWQSLRSAVSFTFRVHCLLTAAADAQLLRTGSLPATFTATSPTPTTDPPHGGTQYVLLE